MLSILAAIQEVPKSDAQKAFEAAVSLSQGLTQWVLLIIGGSILILVGTSYYRPIEKSWRRIYVLFLPGWILMALSIYMGVQVQRHYLAYLFTPAHTPELVHQQSVAINEGAGCQISFILWGLLCFGLWLVAYAAWWFHKQDLTK